MLNKFRVHDLTSHKLMTEMNSSGFDKTFQQLNAEKVKQYYGAIAMLILFLVFGVWGNVHVFLVYTFRMKRTSQRVFVLTITVLDTTTCVAGIPFILVTMFRPITFYLVPVCKIMRLVIYISAGTSGFSLVLIAIDRYLKSCRPLGRQITPYSAKLLCGIALIFNTILLWPAVVLYGKHSVETSNPEVTGASCDIDDAYTTTPYPTYWNVCILITVVLLVALLICLYYKIWRSISEHLKFRAQFSRKDLSTAATSETIDSTLVINQKERGEKRNFQQTNILHSINACQSEVCGTTNSEVSDSKIKSSHGTNNRRSPSIQDERVGTDCHRAKENELKTLVIHDKELEIDNFEENKENNLTIYDLQSALTRNSASVADAGLTDSLDASKHNTGSHGNENDQQQAAASADVSASYKTPTELIKKKILKVRRSKRITIMFLVITVVFFVTFVPHLTVQLLVFINPEFVEHLPISLQITYHIVYNFAFINSMVNCYIYGFFDVKFRHELRKMYKR